MNGLVRILLVAFTVVAAGGCQAVFTYSPFSFLQRDPASLSADQKVTLARDVLESGDREEMESAYDSVNALIDPSSPDPDLSSLAADLAFSASGLTELFSSLLQDPEAVVSGAAVDLETLLDGLDVDLIQEGATHVQNVVDAGAAAVLNDSQYVITGAALVAAAAEEAGGFDVLGSIAPGDAGYETLLRAEEYLQLGNAGDLMALFS